MKIAKNNSKVDQIINSVKNNIRFQKAFTHTSYCNQHNLNLEHSYEVLEFLGDSILNFHVSRYIYHNFPKFNEGQMSKLKQLMVQESTLAFLSKDINLSQYLKLGNGELKNQGNKKESILADIYESFLAVLYLIKGHKTVNIFLQLTLFLWIKGKEDLIWDYKSQLQEYCQAHKNSVSYSLKKTIIMPNNERQFIVEVSDKLQTFTAEGTGKNIKSAEQEAAAKILKTLNLIN